MKQLITILAVVLITLSVIAEEPTAIEEYITQMVEMGIDAGINSCITQGVPRNKYSLELAKARGKALVRAMYPEIKWQWKDPQPVDPKLSGKPEGEQVF